MGFSLVKKKVRVEVYQSRIEHHSPTRQWAWIFDFWNQAHLDLGPGSLTFYDV